MSNIAVHWHVSLLSVPQAYRLAAIVNPSVHFAYRCHTTRSIYFDASRVNQPFQFSDAHRSSWDSHQSVSARLTIKESWATSCSLLPLTAWDTGVQIHTLTCLHVTLWICFCLVHCSVTVCLIERWFPQVCQLSRLYQYWTRSLRWFLVFHQHVGWFFTENCRAHYSQIVVAFLLKAKDAAPL